MSVLSWWAGTPLGPPYASDDGKLTRVADGVRTPLRELIRIVRKIQLLFIRDRPDAPLLHRQGPEEDLNRFALHIRPDLVYDQRVGGDRMSLDRAST